jgi:aminoglycoside phosphotransferase (APT) family kinase protein
MDNLTTHFPDYLSGYRDIPCQFWTGNVVLPSSLPNITQAAPPRHSRQWQERPYFCDTLATLCEENISGTIIEITFPSGSDRSACLVRWENGRTAIASFRNETARARLEERVLHYLNQQDAPVPTVLFFNGIVLLQEALQGIRLSTLLANADSASRKALLAAALSSLHRIHLAAERAGLDQAVPLLGNEEDWIARHIRQLRKIGDAFDIPVPSLDKPSLHDILLPLKPRFVKWDARPGNAMVDDAGKVAWFDWEHCGARNRLDDLVWLLCDESVPFCMETEQALLAEFVPLFADGATLESAHRYAAVAGVLHCTARLGLILHKQQGEEGWWDKQEILDYDYIGVTPQQAQLLCARAAAWAVREPLVAPLALWFGKVAASIESLPNG